ncbi:hypothetical protein F3Y22_tig00111458pilonHSYRG00019 [Hibiscus syriacus]|uniref:Uncharacterized protein n=1 Tax=Hibiscus syriacus TaxID=106335 RepID=A0A6A2Y308_HIBSY|nr:hypothetical protein F3Y22_tig00111458pilonHSYRG00019 [Hibiscus syriacus]
MTAVDANQLISVQPNDLKFLFELDKPSFCNLQLTTQDVHVAFKVKTLHLRSTLCDRTLVFALNDLMHDTGFIDLSVTLQAQRNFLLICNARTNSATEYYSPSDTWMIYRQILTVLRRYRSASLSFLRISFGSSKFRRRRLKELTSQTPDGTLLYSTLRMKEMPQFGNQFSCTRSGTFLSDIVVSFDHKISEEAKNVGTTPASPSCLHPLSD